MATKRTARKRQLNPRTQIPVGNGGQFYKIFRVILGPFANDDDNQPRRLRARFRSDETLQRPGDTASAKGRLRLCRNGWHACRRRYVEEFLTNGLMSWQDGTEVVFRVALRGVHSRRAVGYRDKMVARHITLLHEVEYHSVEGRAVRKACEHL